MSTAGRMFSAAAGLAGLALLLALVLETPRAQSVPETVGPRGSWTMYQRDAAHNAVFAQPGFRANWLVKLGDKINGGLAIVDGTVYADSFDRKLYAIDAATGDVRWSAQADNTLMSTPVVQDGLVIVGSGRDGFLKPDDMISQTWGRPEGDDLLAFATSDGHLVWKIHTDGEDMPSPAIVGDALIFANGDLHAYNVELATGKRRWTASLPGVATMASASEDRGKVFISSCHNAPYVCETRALDARSGQTLWTSPYGGSDCTPTVDNGFVFTNINRNDEARYHTGGVTLVVAMDERTGRTIWTHESVPGPYTFVASAERQIAGTGDRGVLYQPIGNAQRVIAFEERSGKVLWTFHTSANVKMSPIVKGDVVYFGDTAGILYSVNRKTGRLMHATSFLQSFSTSPPVIVGETIFVANGPIVVAMPLDGV